MSKIRTQLTEAENGFYRSLLFKATTSRNFGQPYLRRAFLRLQPVSIENTHTMSIDEKWHVFIDFNYLMQKDNSYALGILNHEIWHPLRKHYARGRLLPNAPREYNMNVIINMAGDLEINDDLLDLIPENLLIPGQGSFKGYRTNLALEQYYQLILKDIERLSKIYPQLLRDIPPNDENPDNNPSSEEQGDSNTNDSEGSGSSDDTQAAEEKTLADMGEQSEQSDNKSEDQNLEQSQEELEGENGGAPQEPSTDEDNQDEQKSGGSAGQPQDSSTESQSLPQCGSSVLNPHKGESEIAELDDESNSVDDIEDEKFLKDIARDIQAYNEEMKNHGVGNSGLGGLSPDILDWASKTLQPKHITWRDVLKGAFRQSYSMQRGKLLYVRNRPSRRQPLPDIFYPALKSPTPTVSIGIDVSGSNLHNLKQVVIEMEHLIKTMNLPKGSVKAFGVNVQASKSEVVSNPLKVFDKLPTGGGTKMTPGYMKLAELGSDISLLITDGEVNDYPSSPPRNPKGKKTRYITVLVLNGSKDSPMNRRLLNKAERYLSSWGKVLPLEILE